MSYGAASAAGSCGQSVPCAQEPRGGRRTATHGPPSTPEEHGRAPRGYSAQCPPPRDLRARVLLPSALGGSESAAEVSAAAPRWERKRKQGQTCPRV